MLEIGSDQFFSETGLFENIDPRANWFDVCPISEDDRQ